MIIGRGAEAIVSREKGKVRKQRPKKSYRLPILDEKLRKFRTRREAKILVTLNKNEVPAPELIESCDKDMRIDMSFLEGEKLKDLLTSKPLFAKEVGRVVGTMHNLNVIHADLTTSNMIYTKKKVHLIDFGLSFVSTKLEDRAVDLNVLDQALGSAHHEVYDKCITLVLEGYQETHKDAKKVLERLKKVQARGRNKQK